MLSCCLLCLERPDGLAPPLVGWKATALLVKLQARNWHPIEESNPVFQLWRLIRPVAYEVCVWCPRKDSNLVLRLTRPLHLRLCFVGIVVVVDSSIVSSFG